MYWMFDILIGFLLGWFVESQREDEPFIFSFIALIIVVILTIPLQIAVYILF